MRCERCGEAIDTYELDGSTAIVCQSCGFLDVPVDHESKPRPHESWQDAFDRFYEKFGGDDEDDEDTASSSPEAEELTSIDGIGPSVAKRLEESGYSSVSELAATTPEELEAVDGIGPRLAAKLLAECSNEDFEAESS